MEPQLVRCGMTPDDAGIPIDNWGPQWSRNLFVAECAAVAGNVGRLAVASMEPQLVRCGMVDNMSSNALNWSLQWSRNLFVAEC